MAVAEDAGTLGLSDMAGLVQKDKRHAPEEEEKGEKERRMVIKSLAGGGLRHGLGEKGLS